MKNLLEEVVAREYEQLKSTIPGFCGCDMCRDDVLVYALNRLLPRYVAQPTGEVLTSLSMGSDQPKADISVVLLEGLRRVKAEPREGHG
ncbi:MAG: late competence development ComFB family protein [Gemmatimonadota bacterium]|nr:MAG: late competence development ComFB family protein [Gemmatimonadota bacterium]